MVLSKQEAGRLGALKSNEISRLAKIDKINEYNSNPKKCLNCEVDLDYSKRKNIFCSSSCSVSHSNTKRKRRRRCEFCVKEHKNAKYCSMDCFFLDKKKKREIQIISGRASSRSLKLYLVQKYGIECWECGETDKLGVPIPIELDHIDGDFENNSLSNCRLLCPTCHAMTENYKAKNIGNGRYSRRMRYKSGKSY